MEKCHGCKNIGTFDNIVWKCPKCGKAVCANCLEGLCCQGPEMQQIVGGFTCPICSALMVSTGAPLQTTKPIQRQESRKENPMESLTPDEIKKKLSSVLVKAWSDEKFKERLMQNATETLSLAGVGSPAGQQFSCTVLSDQYNNEIAIQIAMGPSGKPYYYGNIICSMNKGAAPTIEDNPLAIKKTIQEEEREKVDAIVAICRQRNLIFGLSSHGGVAVSSGRKEVFTAYTADAVLEFLRNYVPDSAKPPCGTLTPPVVGKRWWQFWK